jgi:hypothetical protein
MSKEPDKDGWKKTPPWNGQSLKTPQPQSLTPPCLDAYDFEDDIKIQGVEFLKDVDFSSMHIKGSLTLTNVTIRGKLHLQNMLINNQLILENVIVHAPDTDQDTAIDLQGTTVKDRCKFHVVKAGGYILAKGISAARLELREVISFGEISFEDARIQGGVLVQAIAIEDKPTVDQKKPGNRGQLKLSGLRAEGTVSITDGFIRNGLILDHSNIEGDLNLGDPKNIKRLAIGEISARGGRIKGQLSLCGIKSEGEVRFDCIEAVGGLFIKPSISYRPYISGDLNLSGGRMNLSHIQISGLHLSGSFDMISAETGPISLGLGVVERENNKEIIPSSVGRIVIINSVINGWLSLPFLQVTGVPDSNEITGLFIDQNDIKGDVRFWLDRAFRDVARESQINLKTLPSPWESNATINGPIRITNCLIDGHCRFTRTIVNGGINLRDTSIAGDLLFQSVASGLNDEIELKVEDKTYLENIKKNYKHDRYQCAEAKSLEIEMFKCGGDIDLTGLRLNDLDPIDSKVSAKNIKVDGDIKLFERNPKEITKHGNFHKAKAECYSIIPGLADFTGAQGNRIVFSRKEFENPNATVDDHGIRLLRAKFHVVEVPVTNEDENLFNDELKGKEIRARTLPAPLDLAEFSVDSIAIWERDDDQSIPENVLGDKYSQFLKNQKPFMRSPYRVVEQYLVNRGYNRAAEAVYRSMYERNFSLEIELLKDNHDTVIYKRIQAPIINNITNIQNSISKLAKPIKKQINNYSFIENPFQFLKILFQSTVFETSYLLSLFIITHYILQQYFKSFSDYVFNLYHIVNLYNPFLSCFILTMLVILAVFILYKNTRIWLMCCVNYFWKAFLGYGTQPLGPLGAIFILWATSLPVYLNNENFEPSLGAMASEVTWYYKDLRTQEINKDFQLPKKRAKPDAWNQLDAFAISLRYHVPIIPLELRTEWDLRNENGLYFKFFSFKNCKCSNIDPESYGETMYWVNWVLWSLFLILIIRRLIRPSELGK